MEETSRHSDQEQDLIYALDIGTRSVIGLLARQEQDKMRVLEVERRPHERRTMLDGQIEDIRQVAKVVSEVTKSLEERSGRKLERACVAAAGRALRTERGEYCLELSAPEIVKGERISQLELEAVAAAERTLQDKEQEQRMFLVGYTVTQLRLDHYPMTSLEGHTGQVLEAAVVATFLPSEVVDSLYAVMVEAGLEADPGADCGPERSHPGGHPPAESGAGGYWSRDHGYRSVPGWRRCGLHNGYGGRG